MPRNPKVAPARLRWATEQRELELGTLRVAADANPDHEFAKIIHNEKNCCFPNSHKLVVDVLDFQALCENCEVTINRQIQGRDEVMTKSLGKSLGTSPKLPKDLETRSYAFDHRLKVDASDGEVQAQAPPPPSEKKVPNKHQKADRRNTSSEKLKKIDDES